MQYLNKESRLWIFSDSVGLTPVQTEYPLLEFDRGKQCIICPYYLHLGNDLRISEAYFNYSLLTVEQKEIIDDAVKNCKNSIPIGNTRFIENRHAEILMIYAKRFNNTEVNEELFNDFYDFIQVRQKYLDISPCLIIPPIEHDERMECINQAWIDAFKMYLKETK